MKLRPFSGSSVTCRAVMVWPMLALPVSSVTAAAFTSTVSATLPASRPMSTRWIWSTVSWTSDRTANLNPACSAVTV